MSSNSIWTSKTPEHLPDFIIGGAMTMATNVAAIGYMAMTLISHRSDIKELYETTGDMMKKEEIANLVRLVNAPIVADAEAGFGGPLHAFELMKSMIQAGASGVHYEDQLASEKKCGHLGGKVLVPTSSFKKTSLLYLLRRSTME